MPNEKVQDIYQTEHFFRSFLQKQNFRNFLKHKVVVDQFFKKESNIVLMHCVPLCIPKSNSNNPNFFQTSQKFLTSAFGVFKFQIFGWSQN
jgi:hypothetical protein